MTNLSREDFLSTKGWEVPGFRVDLWARKTSRWCVVIPVINEGERIKRMLTKMHEIGVPSVTDIIIIDGGSTDGSLALDRLNDCGVAALLTKTSEGKLSAQLRCAYAFALEKGYDGIVTIDGNDKDDPADIAGFVSALENGLDFAQASRFIAQGVGKNTPFIREIAIRLIHAPMLSLFSGFKWTDTTQGFRAYSRKFLLDERVAPFRDVFMQYELLAYLSYRGPKLGFKCIELPTTRIYPVGDVPTKISGFSGNIDLILTLAKACFGFFNPKLKK